MHLRLVWLLLSMQTLFCRAQQSQQLTLVNENDNYLLTYTDRYYTNGIMVRYTAAARQPGRFVKKLTTLELGQQIFTPYSVSPEYRKDMDRPFTGYLYLKAVRTHVQPSGRLLHWGLTAGVVGEKAFGREVQRWHHRTWHLKYPFGWQQQLHTGVGLNLEGRVVQPLLHLGTARFGVRLNGSGQATIGNLFAQATTGMHLRLGASTPNGASAACDTRVGHRPEKAHTEWFLFVEPQLTRQWYNATLQGAWHQHAHHYFTTTPQPLVCQQRIGFVYAPRRWTATLAYTHKSKEASTMHTSERWGTVAVAYRW